MDSKPTPSQQVVNRLYLAFKDMQDAMRYLDAYTQLNQVQRQRDNNIYFDHCEAILSAAVVAYCRPFKNSRAKGQASPKLVADSLLSVRNQRALHALLETKRDTFIAHADWEGRSTTFLRIDGDAVLRQSPTPSVHKGLNVEDFRALVVAVGTECRREAFRMDFSNGAGEPNG